MSCGNGDRGVKTWAQKEREKRGDIKKNKKTLSAAKQPQTMRMHSPFSRFSGNSDHSSTYDTPEVITVFCLS